MIRSFGRRSYRLGYYDKAWWVRIHIAWDSGVAR